MAAKRFLSLPLSVTYTEAALIDLLIQGDQSAYSYVYDHYGAALYGVILKIVERPVIAEDVLQDVFLKIYHNIGQYNDTKGRLYTWMLHIARNTAIDMTRSKGFKDEKKIRSLDNGVDIEADHHATSSVDHLGLDKVLSSLNDDQKKVIELAYYKGYTQEEISRELQQPLGTVKTHIRGALQQLRKRLNIS